MYFAFVPWRGTMKDAEIKHYENMSVQYAVISKSDKK